jgi:broad specificity phosphatase PhoE
MLRSDWFCSNIIFVRHAQSSNNCIYETVREKFGDSLSAQQYEDELNKLHNPDPELSLRGCNQANLLGSYLQCGSLLTLKQSEKWVVYSSPMRRCLLTAQQVARGLSTDSKVIVHPQFFESDGCFRPMEDGTTVGLPGATAAEVEAEFPNFSCMPEMETGYYKHPCKETEVQFRSRCSDAADFLWNYHNTARDHPVENNDNKISSDGLVIVAHGNFIAAVISELVGTRNMFLCDNTGLTHLQLWSERLPVSNDVKKTGNTLKTVSLQYLNRIDHLVADPSLVTGSNAFDDHWIQEFFVDRHKKE